MHNFLPLHHRKCFQRTCKGSVLSVCLLICSIAFCGSAVAQTATFTMTLRNTSIEKVFEDIEQQSSYRVLYSKKIIARAKPVTVVVDKASLETVLGKCFYNQPFDYVVQEQSIIVTPKKNRNGALLPRADSTISIQGHVVDDKGGPLPGAGVRVKGTQLATVTDANGAFSLSHVKSDAMLVITFIGFVTREQPVSDSGDLIIALKQGAQKLSEVIVSTGYQTIAAERATGSFVKVDSALLNRRVSTNFIDRLEGVTSGLVFNHNLSGLDPNASPISIRGRSTIFANTKPLIVVDNFPYEGDLDNINPNDIADISILKDAAAASIWGARAANGVIVVTTKKGKINQPLQVSLNSSMTIGEKPNLFYSPNFLDASDFIDLETYLFDKGYYNATLNSKSRRNVLTPVVDILAAERAGTVSQSDANAQINAFRGQDVRNDFNKYFYRRRFDQQESLTLSGGSTKATYLFSAGYDNDISNLVRNDYSRVTLNENTSYEPVRNLNLSIGIHYATNKLDNNNPGYAGITSNGSAIYPYAAFAGPNGNALAVSKDHPYSYVSAQTDLLDWSYRPLDELNLANNVTHVNDIRINPSISYKFTNWLTADVRYQYDKQFTENDNIQSQDGYYVRNLVNLYSQVNAGTVTRPIPYGDIYDKGVNDYAASIFRGQLNFNKEFGSKNFVSAIAGLEYQQQITDLGQYRLYGYNSEAASSSPVAYGTIFPAYQNLAPAAAIPYKDGFDEMVNELRSYFVNASYTYDDKYTVSGSARFDQSNLFGVNTNQKGVPLWSAGLSWAINKEAFYQVQWLPELRLRATYGINGNIDRTLTAFNTGRYSVSDITNAPDVYVTNPPNPDLRWEKDRMLNIGLDFGLADRRISGSIEYFHRKGTDIVGYTVIDPTSGFSSYKGNVADMEGQGIDLKLNSRNLTGLFKWNTTFLFSKATDKVTRYNAGVTPVSTIVQSGDGTLDGTISSFFVPVTGHPVFSVYSYKWAGLDPQTGDPMGYLNGAVSKDYASITSSTNANDLVYNGPANPTLSGSLRNDFSYKAFTLSINITYEFGFYFRRPSVNYQNLFGLYIGNKDYLKRWQKPGDEQSTYVPSLVYPDNLTRDNFYTYSSVLVEKGDNVRLQDIRLSYDLKTLRIGSARLNNLQLFAYANNLGILWRANKYGLDPDFVNGYPDPKTWSLGLNLHF